MNITIEISNKYLKGKIYKVVDIGYNKCYVGSTCAELSHRMSSHMNNYKQFIKGKIKDKVSIYDLFNEYGVENCKIELLEYYPCDTGFELRLREGKHIKHNECVNKCIAGRTRKEYFNDIKDKHSEFMKKYYKENQEKIKENCKEYYNQHQDTMKEHMRNYASKKIVCGCGKEYSRGNKNHHEKSSHHHKWLEEKV